jgi:hypothetical protein
MGLDISHIKAVWKIPATTDPNGWGTVWEEDYTGFNVGFNHFSKYIQKVDRAFIVQTIIIVEEQKYLEETIAWFQKYDYPILFKDSEASLQKQINLLESHNHLHKLNKHLNTTPARWNVLDYYEVTRATGFYTEDIGYQRKGMNDKFWNRFYSEDVFNFALPEDFAFAYDCVDHCWPSDTEEDVRLRRLNFRQQFLETYEFGASYLALSY